MTPDRASRRVTARYVTSLLKWSAVAGRTYPWRERRGYTVAVAEILLQKTRGDAVEGIWRRVVERYPSPDRLARAQPAYLRRTVAPLGLGEQRASRLKLMARDWANVCRGGKVNGLGPYGLAIVRLSIGRRPSTVPIDGNIARVISRVHGFRYERGEPRKKPEVRGAVQSLIDRRTPERSIEVLYALVDLGATVCTPRSPKCESCPLEPACVYAARQTH